MNKRLLIILIIIILVSILFFIFLQKRNKLELNSNLSNQQRNNENNQKLENINQHLSEKNLFEQNISMVCSYKIQNNLDATTYIKGRMIKTVTNIPNDINYNLVRDNKVYQWNDSEKKGVVMLIQKQPGLEIENLKRYIDDMMIKYKPNCKQADLSDDIFVIPQNVQFQDVSQLFSL